MRRALALSSLVLAFSSCMSLPPVRELAKIPKKGCIPMSEACPGYEDGACGAFETEGFGLRGVRILRGLEDDYLCAEGSSLREHYHYATGRTPIPPPLLPHDDLPALADILALVEVYDAMAAKVRAQSSQATPKEELQRLAWGHLRAHSFPEIPPSYDPSRKSTSRIERLATEWINYVDCWPELTGMMSDLTCKENSKVKK